MTCFRNNWKKEKGKKERKTERRRCWRGFMKDSLSGRVFPLTTQTSSGVRSMIRTTKQQQHCHQKHVQHSHLVCIIMSEVCYWHRTQCMAVCSCIPFPCHQPALLFNTSEGSAARPSGQIKVMAVSWQAMASLGEKSMCLRDIFLLEQLFLESLRLLQRRWIVCYWILYSKRTLNANMKVINWDVCMWALVW